MTSNRLSCWLCWLTAMAAMCLMSMTVQAQDLATKGYWLGVACVPVTDELRDELKLGDVQGVIIVQMIPQSPAAKAGLQQHDVLVAAGDKPLVEVQDLIAAVNDAQGKPLKLSYLRDGDRREVEVTPARRGESYPVPLPGDTPFNVQIFRPGHMVPPRMALRLRQRELPEDMTVTIKKHGKDPAQVSVSQGDKTWEATEDKLDELPAEVRQHVEPMLGRVSMALPSGVGDVLTYLPDVDDLQARTRQAREAARHAAQQAEEAAQNAGDEAEQAARQAVHDAAHAARKAGRDIESQAYDLKRQALGKVREAREAAEKYAGEKADVAIEEGRKWVDRHLDERFDDVNRRLDELRKMIDVLRGERAAPAPAAEAVPPGKPDTPAEKPEDL